MNQELVIEHLTEDQLASFQIILEQQRAEMESVLAAPASECQPEADPLDQASQLCDAATESRGKERAYRQIREIDAALLRIAEGRFGICEITGDPIDLRRLSANPTARLSMEAQQAQELRDRRGC